MNNQLSTFLDQQVLPRLFDQLDSAFPEMGWKRQGSTWVATNETWCRATHSCRADRVTCYENSKHCYLVQGDDTRVTWVSYVMGVGSPRGRDFVTAVERLAQKAGVEMPDDGTPQEAKRFSIEWARRQVAALHANAAALEWLTKTRGFSHAVIERCFLGLTVKPMGAPGEQYANALVFPHIGANGKPLGHYYQCDVPGVTAFDKANDHRKGATWGKKMPGAPLYYSAPQQGKKSVLLVEGFKDLFAVCTLLEGDALAQELLVVTATHGAGSTLKTPELTSPTWWQQFDKIYLGLDNDAAGLKAIDGLLPFIPKEAVVPLIPDRFATKEGKRADWNDLLLRGTRDDFKAILASARPKSAPVAAVPVDANGSAIAFEEVDVQVAYHNGYLYWPFEMPIRTEEGGKMQEEFRSFVLRSDGLLLDIHESPRVSERGRSIKRLSDGTPILRVPRPVRTSQTSWHYSSIKEFVETARGGQLQLLPRPSLGELVERIYKHLRASVWLPYREDYTTVTLGIVTSYCQEIFEAVPLFMLVGDRGSGKTELSTHAAALGCNGVALGRTTRAGLEESCTQFRGLVAVDDFEELAMKSGKGGANVINDMAQVIKQSYKKASGTHTRVGERGELVVRNLFGVKFLNNTLGADPITLSRMFCVRTRRMTEETKNEMQKFATDLLTVEQVREIRNNLHFWIYSHVPEIAGLAAELKKDRVNRDDEIALPLRVLARLAERPYVVADLEAAIARRLNANTETDEETALRESLRTLIAEGNEWISVYHVMNEMATHLSPTYGADSKADLPEWQRPHVLGRRLLGFWLDENQQKRLRLAHQDIANFRPRFYRVLDDRRSELLNELEKESTGRPPVITPKKQPGDFCAGCEECRYKAGCFIRREYNAKTEKGAN